MCMCTLRVSCLWGDPSPAQTVSSLSSCSCAWLLHLLPSSIWAGAFIPGDSHKVFIIFWMTLEADSIPNSSLSLWLWLAPGKNKMGFRYYYTKLFCWLRTQDFLRVQKRDVAGGQVSSANSSLGPLLFFWEPCHWARTSTYSKGSALTMIPDFV